MAILRSGDDEYPKGETRCLLCFKAFDDGEPVVFWQGPDKMYLHGGCAGSFVLRIARDAWEVEREADDGKFVLTSHKDR